MIHVIAIVTTKPTKRAEVLQAFMANVPTVHAEDGCIEYETVVDREGSRSPLGDDAFMVIEKWASHEHLMAHSASEHMRAFAEKVNHLISDRQVHMLESVSAGNLG